jgi:tubulin polyglutamylase TTLL1
VYSSGGTHGWKWSLQNLLAYIEGTRGLEAAEAMMGSIGWLIVHSLKAVQNVIINDKHCFECYGYDVMLDSDLKPWLIEVNASPSLSTTTTTDRILKTQLIAEVMDLVFPPNFLEAGRGAGIGSRRPAAAGEEPVHQGHFELLYDESAEIEAERLRKELEAARGGRKSISSKTGPGRTTHAPSSFK